MVLHSMPNAGRMISSTEAGEHLDETVIMTALSMGYFWMGILIQTQTLELL